MYQSVLIKTTIKTTKTTTTAAAAAAATTTTTTAANSAAARTTAVHDAFQLVSPRPISQRRFVSRPISERQFSASGCGQSQPPAASPAPDSGCPWQRGHDAAAASGRPGAFAQLFHVVQPHIGEFL